MSKNRLPLLAAALIGLSLLLGGCDALRVDQQKETVRPTEVPVQTVAQTEAVTEKLTETETEKVTEAVTEALIQYVLYTSQDKSVSLILPDSTWKVTQDADEMRVFSSGAAMINIVHAANESEMKRLTIYRSEEELEESLARQYPEANAFEIQSFENVESDILDTYEYVVNYNSKSMWAYAVTYGILAEDEAYLVTGTVTDDNKTMLKAVKESVETFTVQNNPKFEIPETEEETEAKPQIQSETSVNGDAEADSQLANISVYPEEAELFALDNVNIRVEPSTNADIIGSLSIGESIKSTGETADWYRISYDGTTGYVKKDFLAKTSEDPVNTSSDLEEETEKKEEEEEKEDQSSMIQAEYLGEVPYEAPVEYYTNSDVNVRTQPGTDSDIIDGLGSGLPVQVVGETDNWFVVSVNGQTGYIKKDLLSASYEPETYSAEEIDDTSETGEGADNAAAEYTDEGPSDGSILGGIVLSADADTIQLQAENGSLYTLSYSEASLGEDTVLYEGMYIEAQIQTDGGNGLYAVSITEY